ncbi:protein kinase domain-containing protein [Anaerobacillus sp. MEB173]|uniref:protein kinase domain-containing protein n=1 Tax=Anaerobacillus sp. MEB173 TaxID=3383345 RepID=UPI003F92DF35
MRMNDTTKSSVANLQPGTKILGKWNKKPYKILKRLGYGATGTVYLAESVNGFVALKISENGMSITSEVNVLKHFSKVQGQILGPSLLDVDDWVTPQGTIPFYAMEYLKGTELLMYMSNKGVEWIGILMVQLLGDLDRLHQAGWAFGDLKPDNLLVTGPPARIRWLDVGGTTLIGRSIKEYTEFYDRGYWGLGLRKAEPSYDLFAVAMIMINCSYPARFQKKGEGGLKQLKAAIEAKPSLVPYRHVLLKALQGKYTGAQEMRKDLVAIIGSTTSTSRSNTKSTSSRVNRTQRKSKQKKQKKKMSGFVEFFLITSFLLLAYVLYLFGQLM